MNEKTIIEKDGEEWKTQIPETILTALSQRRRLPKYPFLHWYLLVERKIPTFRVSLGNSRGECLSELNNNETILPECVKDVVKGNTIFWSIRTWGGETIALAKIPDLYGTSITSRVFPTGIEIPDIVKEYLDMRTRTRLEWRKTENGWIIAKRLEPHDFVTFYVFDTLKFPTELKNVPQVKWTLTDYENKPALLLEPLTDSDPFETFVTSLNKTRLPLTRLFALYKNVENVDFKTFLKLVETHGLEITWDKDAHKYWKKVVILPQARKHVTPP